MEQKTRKNDRVVTAGGGGTPDGGEPGGGLESLRETARGLVDDTDDIIRKVMSGDSREFIRMGRQQGGE